MSENEIPGLRYVYLAADVYAICLQHAFTTEKEEVMGLLIGEVDEEHFISNITACVILHRSDKQPDRVEISPEQLCEASNYAQELAHKLNRPMRVLGWYHSHPHITVWPSHVDVRTQAMYQTMDPLFVGLIFSVFQSDKESFVNKVKITCFQSEANENPQRREIPLIIKPTALESHNLEVITDLPKILTREVQELCEESNENDELANLHNNAFRTLELSHIICNATQLMTEDFLQARLNATDARIRELKLLKQQLLSGNVDKSIMYDDY